MVTPVLINRLELTFHFTVLFSFAILNVTFDSFHCCSFIFSAHWCTSSPVEAFFQRTVFFLSILNMIRRQNSTSDWALRNNLSLTRRLIIFYAKTSRQEIKFLILPYTEMYMFANGLQKDTTLLARIPSINSSTHRIKISMSI